MQLIRACWWAAEKPGENPSRPIGAWPGLRNTTSSAIKLCKQTRSPALTASIQVECISRIARSSGPICNLCRRTTRISCRAGCNDFNPRKTRMPARSTASTRSALRIQDVPVSAAYFTRFYLLITSTFDHGNGNSCGQQARHRSSRQQGRQQGDLGLPLSHIVRDSHGALKKGALSFVQGKKMPGKEWLATGSLARILDFREQLDLPPNDRAGIFPPQARLLPDARP